jgi:hypothetical protein
MVIPKVSEDVIVGVNTLQKWYIKLDFEYYQEIVDQRLAVVMLK